jgi:hypothetical protein
VHDRAAPERPRRGGGGGGGGGAWLIGAMALALLVGYAASWCGTLVTEYNVAWSMGSNPRPLNASAVLDTPASFLDLAHKYEAGTPLVADHGSAWRNMGIGAAVTVALSVLRLRYAWWPLHPVGYLLWQSWPLAAAWFSIFLGWASKGLLIRFGGARLYQSARPVFIGLVLGEAAAAAVWLLISVIISLAGGTHHPISLLPG